MISFEFLTIAHFSQLLEVTESCWVIWVIMVIVKSWESETRFGLKIADPTNDCPVPY